MRKLAPISGRNASISPWPAVQAAAEANLVKALSLAPDHAVAHLGLGGVQIMTNRPTQGIAECERALALNQNQADAHAMIAVVKYFTGHALEMEGHIQEAFRIRPCDKWAHVWMALIGTANLALRRDEEAVAWLRRAIENNRNSPTSHLQLAAAFVHLDRLNEARSAAQAGLALNPSFTIARFRIGTSQSDNPTFLAQRERLIDGFRKAGAPEG